jgi:hypothetical protein
VKLVETKDARTPLIIEILVLVVMSLVKKVAVGRIIDYEK